MARKARRRGRWFTRLVTVLRASTRSDFIDAALQVLSKPCASPSRTSLRRRFARATVAGRPARAHREFSGHGLAVRQKPRHRGDVGIRAGDPVRTASTIKLPILCAVFDQVAAGKAKWTEPLTVTRAGQGSGSGIIGTELSDGVQLPLRDVAHLMIVLSDNTATNMILERFTADAVNAYLDKIGIKTTRSMRKVRGDGTQLKAAEGWSAAGSCPRIRSTASAFHAARHGDDSRKAGARRNCQPRSIQGNPRDPETLPGFDGRAAPLSGSHASPIRPARWMRCAPMSRWCTRRAGASPWRSPWTTCRSPSGRPTIRARC